MRRHTRANRHSARHFPWSVVDWLRAGYPDDAPETGYSPLIALNGPLSLSQRQTQHIVEELEDQPADPISIQVAITKATDCLPTEAQFRKVRRSLQQPSD
jgi:hypothetical protein